MEATLWEQRTMKLLYGSQEVSLITGLTAQRLGSTSKRRQVTDSQSLVRKCATIACSLTAAEMCSVYTGNAY